MSLNRGDNQLNEVTHFMSLLKECTDYLCWRQVGVWRYLMGLGQAPEGAPPWRELGMGHEEPGIEGNVFVLRIINNFSPKEQ